MINYLKGTVLDKRDGNVIVDVNDIGYAVFVGDKDLEQLKSGQEIKLFTYHHIRENVSDLYGFFSSDDLEFFKILISVAGIGPKSALNIISKAGITNIHSAIIKNDAALLSGIGKKTAEKIVNELKGKINSIKSIREQHYPAPDAEITDALANLGFNPAEIKGKINRIPGNITELDEKIKWVLKNK